MCKEFFKDNDFLEDDYKLLLPEDARQKLIDMLNADTEFLAKLRLMDYSLLVGVFFFFFLEKFFF